MILPEKTSSDKHMQSTSLRRVIGEAFEQTKLFVGQELQLLKAELSEKAAHYKGAAAKTGIGLSVLYVAVLVVLAGFGLLLSFVLQKLGLDLLPARGAGFGGVGLLVIIAGAVVLLKAVKSLSKATIAPEKTLYTIKRMKPVMPEVTQARKPEPPRRAAKDIETDVRATEQRLGRNLEALAGRVSPIRFLRMASARVQARPVRWNLAALATGFAGSVWFVKKLRK
jgi:hypothetical protein